MYVSLKPIKTTVKGIKKINIHKQRDNSNNILAKGVLTNLADQENLILTRSRER